MQLQKETQKLVNKVVKNWETLKSKEKLKKEDYGSEFTSVIGELYWDNPNCLWVLATQNEEGYDGSQTQIGLTKEGKIVWEYQSHCSCDGYYDSHEHLPELDLSKKNYELDKIPLDWENKIQENIKKILKDF